MSEPKFSLESTRPIPNELSGGVPASFSVIPGSILEFPLQRKRKNSSPSAPVATPNWQSCKMLSYLGFSGSFGFISRPANKDIHG